MSTLGGSHRERTVDRVTVRELSDVMEGKKTGAKAEEEVTGIDQ